MSNQQSGHNPFWLQFGIIIVFIRHFTYWVKFVQEEVKVWSKTPEVIMKALGYCELSV